MQEVALLKGESITTGKYLPCINNDE